MTPDQLRERMLRELAGGETPATEAASDKVHWCRVAMNREAQAFVASLPCGELDVLEVSGTTWSDPRFGFRSYRSLAYPDYDICRGPLQRQICDLLILEQVLEHVRQPHQALANALAMLRPGGSLLLNTPFLIKFHPCPVDLYRWTEDGLRILLEEAGFTAIRTGSWGNRACLAADMQPGMQWTYYDPAVHSLENEVQFPVSVWAFARRPAPWDQAPYSRRHPAPFARSFGVMVLTRNGAGRIEDCLQSILEAGFADEIVVCVDCDTTDETAALARRFTPHVHQLAVPGGIPEAAMPAMASHCSADYLLRLDDDETLGGNWDRAQLEALVRYNDLTHLILPRRWLVPPGPDGSPRFIASEPWFPDYQVRFFRHDPELIRWPTTIHETIQMKGRGMVLFDRWLEHYDLALNSRAARERKALNYRRIRPEKHLSNFYLYEEQQPDLLPADRAGFTEALEIYISGRERHATQPGTPYRAGAEVRFETGGNAVEYTRKGWSDPEPWGRWTNGYRAELRMLLERPFEGPAVLAVEAVAYVRDWHPTLHVRVVCNREEVGGWSIESGEMRERTLPIPASALAGRRELLLFFQVDNPATPADSGDFGLDQRLLGLGLRKLRLSAAPG
jgi:glycosyltransferase involved in cell wall biosynthesis